MYDNAIADLAFYCVDRVALLDRFAEIALTASLILGTVAGGLAAWKTYRDIKADPSDSNRNRSALPGGIDALVAAISAAPVWVGLLGAGIALSYTATGFSEKVCLLQPPPPPPRERAEPSPSASTASPLAPSPIGGAGRAIAPGRGI